ncbi:hypothetical protein NA57DRAFT_80663 [Rhizodiscina lignyota]|uniref:Amino acid permease/ SLC12A domain-containing protein n=1 Tax=Rhizodiscina lignyota TaxID=1504668 RepID=A0A9P4I3E0_9PEZI|nr:hypothetical protein NA57DRAFT_80663 [Rhizodiscina lignyota]
MDAPERDHSPEPPPSVLSVQSSGSPDHATELRPKLSEGHVNMMTFSAVLGVGLFLQSGRVIFLCGPGLAVIAYIVTGTVMWSTMASLGEMTAVFPVKGAVFEFPRRFLDNSIGFAVAWLFWFSWVVINAAELLAITQIINFEFPTEYLKEQGYPDETLRWPVGQNTSPAVWVFIFLLIVGLVNLLPVRWFGRLEYVFGCIKITFLSGLIFFNVIVNARKRFHDSRFWTYKSPYSFASHNMTVRADPPIVYEGSLGTFTAMWSGMTYIIFSMIGFEVVAITAAENHDLRREETIKLASRKISLRIILFYSLSVFVVGLNVPYTDSQLQQLTINSPQFFTGFFVFSATTSAINSLYIASRSLHALACLREAWPEWGPIESLRSRLERTKYGVPYVALFVSWLFGLLAFLSTENGPSQVLGRLATNSVVSMLIVYIAINAAYLQFYRCVNAAARGEDRAVGKDSAMTRLYDRRSPNWAYKSHIQWLRAAYALTATVLFLIFNGWRSFAQPFSGKDFIASYISVLIFVILTILYFIKLNGLDYRNWRRNASYLRGLTPVYIDSGTEREPCGFCGARHRRGQLNLPDKDRFTSQNIKAFMEWLANVLW